MRRKGKKRVEATANREEETKNKHPKLSSTTGFHGAKKKDTAFAKSRVCRVVDSRPN